MGRSYAKTMFGEASQRLQQRFGSRASYMRLAEQGQVDSALGPNELEFIAARDSFYLASVTEDGWPYVQHRGGPAGFFKVLDPGTLAFADFAGNKQYITAGNLATNDQVALFLIDYPNQARLKIIGHASLVGPGEQPELEAAVALADYRAKVERIFRIAVVAFDWNCSQHITPRYTVAEIEHASAGQRDA